MHQRRSQAETLSFGLYPRWGRYVPYLSLLLGLLSRSFVAKVLVSVQDHNPVHGQYNQFTVSVQDHNPFQGRRPVHGQRAGPQPFSWSVATLRSACRITTSFKVNGQFKVSVQDHNPFQG